MENVSSIWFVPAAILLHGLSGIPGLFCSRRSTRAPYGAAGLSVAASLLGLFGAFQVMTSHAAPPPLALPFHMIGSEDWSVGMDALSAFFLVPLFLLGGLGALYGLRYWAQEEHPENGRKTRLFWGFCVAGMALLLIARHAILFLLGWEAMALSAFFLVSAEDHLPEVRQSGWIYLVATHAGTLTLFAFFALYYRITGTLNLHPIGGDQAGLGALSALFLLALVGFGLKAGMMPLHFWLPGAHANAPTHVSALMSGVLIKMGIYGMIRFIGFLPAPPASWGVLILISGCLSGILGVLFAIGQHDLKRLLAYHSVENIGIILMGFGLAMIGRSLNRPLWILLGLGGCLLHVWNHALFKGLLFLSAGSVVHTTHTRRIDRLGGLAKAMPWTAALFLVGAVAICGLPPLNGFISEWFIYLGLLHTLNPSPSGWAAISLAVPALALIGALALTCFVKVYGTVFLGRPRSDAAQHAHEAPLSMRAPMLLLALLCVLIGLFPWWVTPMLNQAVAVWMNRPSAPEMNLAQHVPLNLVTVIGVAFFLFAGWISFRLFHSLRRAGGKTSLMPTWSCGYARPTAHMQYTASSFVQALLHLFRGIMRPHEQRPDMHPTFPKEASFSTHVDEPVLDRQILPLGRLLSEWFGKARPIQRGLINEYLLYVLLAVVALLVWTMPLGRLCECLFTR
ncbi:MAG: proton-conducting transporter membrane subunit [Kiritimatiellae bacterium]|nr:proton-conducting transporter membrane subunit [Kiritimatiellia bacterium]